MFYDFGKQHKQEINNFKEKLVEENLFVLLSYAFRAEGKDWGTVRNRLPLPFLPY